MLIVQIMLQRNTDQQASNKQTQGHTPTDVCMFVWSYAGQVLNKENNKMQNMAEH